MRSQWPACTEASRGFQSLRPWVFQERFPVSRSWALRLVISAPFPCGGLTSHHKSMVVSISPHFGTHRTRALHTNAVERIHGFQIFIWRRSGRRCVCERKQLRECAYLHIYMYIYIYVYIYIYTSVDPCITCTKENGAEQKLHEVPRVPRVLRVPPPRVPRVQYRTVEFRIHY